MRYMARAMISAGVLAALVVAAGCGSDDDEAGSGGAEEPPEGPDERRAYESRSFGTEAVPPSPDFVEVNQSTTVYRNAASAAAALDTFDRYEGCGAEVDEEYGQVTEGWAEVPPPDGIELEARVVTATMTVQSNGRVFPHSYGCAAQGPVVQCISVWTLDKTSTDDWFAKTFSATATNLFDQAPT